VHEPLAEMGEAIAGMVRKVGIRASVRPLPLTLYVRLRGDGKLTSFLGFYPTSAYPDLDNLLDFFFDGNRDYWGSDPAIKEAQEKGIVELDPKKRDAIYEKAIDHINQQNDIMPIADLPMVFVHSKDIEVKENRVSPIQTVVTDFYWAP
jgi:peptide/nickel transport system substrate-binding protein